MGCMTRMLDSQNIACYAVDADVNIFLNDIYG